MYKSLWKMACGERTVARAEAEELERNAVQALQGVRQELVALEPELAALRADDVQAERQEAHEVAKQLVSTLASARFHNAKSAQHFRKHTLPGLSAEAAKEWALKAKRTTRALKAQAKRAALSVQRAAKAAAKDVPQESTARVRRAKEKVDALLASLKPSAALAAAPGAGAVPVYSPVSPCYE